jgi:Methylase involved in ubiquinone/menaquinone biosynthesis
MLAVFEHIEPFKIENSLKEIYRILKPGGRFILTTPALGLINCLDLWLKLN